MPICKIITPRSPSDHLMPINRVSPPLDLACMYNTLHTMVHARPKDCLKMMKSNILPDIHRAFCDGRIVGGVCSLCCSALHVNKSCIHQSYALLRGWHTRRSDNIYSHIHTHTHDCRQTLWQQTYYEHSASRWRIAHTHTTPQHIFYVRGTT